nr:hypothetical protein [Bacteroidota bacterium]
MKKIATIILSSMIVLIMMNACLKDDSDILPITKVKILMYDILSATERLVQFSFETEQVYSCGNSMIRYDNTVSNELISIHLKDIEQPSLCVGSDSPAFVNIVIGSLQSGDYPVEIKVGSYINTGTLIVSDSHYVLNIATPQLLEVEYDTLQRIPVNTIWGLVGYYYASASTTADFFLDSLENLGAVPKFLNPGEYGYFQVDTSGNIIKPSNSSFNNLKTFDYNYENSFDDIEDLIGHVDFFYPGEVKIYLYNWKGETFLSGSY